MYGWWIKNRQSRHKRGSISIGQTNYHRSQITTFSVSFVGVLQHLRKSLQYGTKQNILEPSFSV
jgi:hypothetical protein